MLEQAFDFDDTDDYDDGGSDDNGYSMDWAFFFPSSLSSKGYIYISFLATGSCTQTFKITLSSW